MFTIKTERLLLRDLVTEDWKLFLDLMKDEDTRYYMGDYIKADTEEQAKSWIEEKIRYNSESPRHSFNLAIELKGNPIGWIGIGEVDSQDKGDLDFGYALLRDFWRQGLMTESLKAVIDYCFKSLPIHRITGECEEVNLASMKVMEKAGMTLQKRYLAEDKTSGKLKEKLRFYIDK